MTTARKRISAFFLAFVMVLTAILPAMGTVIVHAQTNKVIKLHYHREDGNYTDWDVWAWATKPTGASLSTDPPYDFYEEKGEMVATIVIPDNVTQIGYIVRYKDWGDPDNKKDVDADQYIDIPEVASGAVHYYVESGVAGGQKVYGDDVVIKPTVLKVHYYRADGDYTGWDIYSWGSGQNGGFPLEEENGEMVATIPVAKTSDSIGYIVRYGGDSWTAKDPGDGDRYVDVSNIVCGTVHVKCTSGSWDVETTYDADVVTGTKVKTAKYKGEKQVEVVMTGEVDAADYDKFKVSGPVGEIAITHIAVANLADGAAFLLTLEADLDPLKEYYVSFKGAKTKIVLPDFFSSEEFESAFTYEGDDLGLSIDWHGAANFKVWAPMADQVKVNIYESGDPNADDLKTSVLLFPGEKGTFSGSVAGYSGMYYTYTIVRGDNEVEVCDPYARTTGVNGKRAMILNLATTDPEGWEDDKNPHAGETINDAIIYELHMRDLSADPSSNITNVGKFLQFTETGTKTANGDATGIDHIKELGVTHVHVLPMYDYGSVDETNPEGQYNWGYDPVNYNVPEGSYSTDPYHGEVRVKELKQMVQAMHNNGLSVVMDVVYNHVQDGAGFCINQILPYYFSRVSDEGVFSNGSGCGNDTASERSMVRKYIVDSVVYWATEYHLDGFRFDLVGLLDTETVNAIVNAVHAVRPDVIFYGEGWDMATAVTKEEISLATQKNSGETPDFAYFNDGYRDNAKGSVFDDLATGYVNSYGAVNAAKMQNSWMAKEEWSDDPTQIVQYTCCHDNLTIWDKLALSASDASENDRVRMNLLLGAMTLTAQGVPFIMNGEEMLRSKEKEDGSFEHNSYKSPDSVNSIKWDTLAELKVATAFEYYKGLIEFRKAHSSLRLTSASDVAKNVIPQEGLDDGVLAFYIAPAKGDDVDGIFVIFNPTKENTTVKLPEGEWAVYVDDESAGNKALYKINKESVNVASISAMVLVDEKDGSGPEITVSPKKVTVYTGETAQLTARTKPEDLAYAWMVIENSLYDGKKVIASVDGGDGTVTGVSIGRAVVGAVEYGGTAFDTATVTVKGKQVYQCIKGQTVRYVKSITTARSLKADGYKVTRVFFAAGKSNTPVYWVYATKTKHYRYTTDRKYAISKKKAGCKAGLAFYAAYSGKGASVYELSKNGVYRYTTDRDEALKLKSSGYTYKGVGFIAEE